jgi:inorganic triphosphatase YgiF
MPTETELKFSLTNDEVPSPSELAAGFEAVGLRLGPVRHTVVKDRYYDDARLSLARAGLALRRRMADGELLATLKTLGDIDGALHRREELELPLAEDADPWNPWPDEIAERVRVVTDPRSLRGTIELTTSRTLVDVREGERTVAVASFDDVEARRGSGGRTAHWNELEIERPQEGEDDVAAAPDAAQAALERAADGFRAVLALVPASSTKLERARALLMLGAALDDEATADDAVGGGRGGGGKGDGANGAGREGTPS